MSEVKQIIVMRKDLNMRKGKMIAQGAHASMGAVLPLIKDFGASNYTGSAHFSELSVDLQHQLYYMRAWLERSFAKICVYVNSEQELLDVVGRAQSVGIINCLITDSGRTEFHGVPTLTCAAIGPDSAENLDPITGGLPLL